VVGGNESILIAEDEESLRRTATRLLERLGYRVLAVANGEEALAALEAHGPEIHLLVSDVSMPRMGGHELREKVRHRFPHLRFLFATGYSAESLRGDGLRIEPTELITKPYSLAELAAAVRRVLNATAGT
jgi:CheY-like chemotaxis protein